MKPTTRLRFVRKTVYVTEQVKNAYGDTGTISRPTRKDVLQQWWEDKGVVLSVHITDQDGNQLPSPYKGEWRDVPMETEQ